MNRQMLEFHISQYVDGTLSPGEVAALESTLANDPAARAILEDFRKVDATLKTTEIPLPPINWNRLAEHISAAVAEEDRATTSIPIRGWWVRRVSVAAAVLIAAGLVIFWPKRAGQQQVVLTPPTITVVQINGPETSVNAPVVEVNMPAPAGNIQPANYRIAEDIIYHPPRVVIASGEADGQDTASRLPY
jgi:anti-sigma factor RsiW